MSFFTRAAVLVAALMAAPVMAQQATANGEVRRISTAEKKITIKHGAISELELPAMTLVYLIDEDLLVGIAPGDLVKFTAERKEGDYVIINLKKR